MVNGRTRQKVARNGSGTNLNIIVIPALYLKYGRSEAGATSTEFATGRESMVMGD